jgi:hypothetical protein
VKVAAMEWSQNGYLVLKNAIESSREQGHFALNRDHCNSLSL